MAFEQRCPNGHYYDPAKHTSCPFCGVAGLDVGKTMPSQQSSDPTHPKNQPLPGDAQGRTQGYYEDRMGFDPPVGWLVCIDGPNRGTDYKIRSGNNSMGRSELMWICISGDQTIDRDHHGAISYDPESNTYNVLPGTSRGIVYLNRGPVYSPAPLRPFDEIKLGNTTLLFVPLCGDFGGKGFRWT